MVLPVLVAIIAAPALLGTQEAIRQSQAKEKREEHRARRCNLIASCVKSSLRSTEINGRPIVLKDGKLWIDTGTSDGEPYGHPYAGYYLPYPDTKYEGLVTTITDVAPIMNWVYIDKDTYEVKYGVRLDAQPNFTGPFDCTRQDRRLTFDGWEGFCAVEEFPTLWALYFDKDDDGLRSKVAPGTRVLEIELARKEKRWKRDTEARQQDQTTKRAVDAKEDTPVDDPITTQPELTPPGVTGIEGDEAADAGPKPFMMPKSLFADERPLAIPKSIFADEGRPFAIPQSIFADEERPMGNGPEGPPQPPKTPPPAYSTTVPPSTLPKATPPKTSASVTPPPISTLPLFTTPDLPSSASPPGPLRPTPPSEKRTTPKLNRNSGTRALAQAQMFEAMALGQKPNNETPARNGNRTSRPTSSATTASDYSNPPKTGVTDIFQMYLDRPDSTILPSAVDEVPPLPPVDPAVFGADSTLNASPKLRRKPSFRSTPDVEPPKAAPPPLPNASGPTRRPSVTKGSSRTNVQEGSRALSPEQRRLPSSKEPARLAPRNPPRPATNRQPPSFRARNNSTSSQSKNEDDTNSSPRPLARTNTAPARKSMAATMTSGTRNRGMATRLGSKDGAPDMPKLERSRTNSDLYREIDGLVNPARGRTGPPVRRGSTERRPPPLRRAATSRGPMREDDGRARERPREPGRGVVSRAEREDMGTKF